MTSCNIIDNLMDSSWFVFHTREHLEKVRKNYKKDATDPIKDDDIVQIEYIPWLSGYSTLRIERFRAHDHTTHSTVTIVKPFTAVELNTVFNLGHSRQDLIHMKLSNKEMPGICKIAMPVDEFIGDRFSFLV